MGTTLAILVPVISVVLAVLGWLFFTHRMRLEYLCFSAVGVVVTGACLNLLVQSLNRWKMPVLPLDASEALRIAGSERWLVMNGETHLNALGDWIPFGSMTVSIGDIFMTSGGTALCILGVLLSVRDRRTTQSSQYNK